MRSLACGLVLTELADDRKSRDHWMQVAGLAWLMAVEMDDQEAPKSTLRFEMDRNS